MDPALRSVHREVGPATRGHTLNAVPATGSTPTSVPVPAAPPARCRFLRPSLHAAVAPVAASTVRGGVVSIRATCDVRGGTVVTAASQWQPAVTDEVSASELCWKWSRMKSQLLSSGWQRTPWVLKSKSQLPEQPKKKYLNTSKITTVGSGCSTTAVVGSDCRLALNFP